MTRQLLKIFLLVAFIVAAAQATTFASNTESVELRNRTDKPIVALECVALRNR